ncbi:MAG: VOC family protein [Rhodanobacter sp.]
MAVDDSGNGVRVSRMLRMRLCSAEATRLAAFYETALGFARVSVEHFSGARSQELFAVGGRVLRITLDLGAQRLVILQFVDQRGRIYPAGTNASDLIFQHFAIVVADMDMAMAQLGQVRGWSPITTGGPQQLPASSGGVTAFKFRDPDGHPLELLAFPSTRVPRHWRRQESAGPFLGIDHSAITVSNTERSVVFYESLGFKVSNRSVNDDPAQARLDHLHQPRVDVTALSIDDAPPHLELLCYRNNFNGGPLRLPANDVAATCLVLERHMGMAQHQGRQAPIRNLVDPDGHHLSIVSVVA